MILRSPAESEIALTPALPSEWGREFFELKNAQCEPSPACGRGKGEGLVPTLRCIFEGVYAEYCLEYVKPGQLTKCLA
jgi:hypothetical protein